jgi:hypothetical protein
MNIRLARDRNTSMPPLHPSVDGLWIWHCRYRTLEPVGDLHKLKYLVIATYPDDSLALLAGLRNLRDLRIMHLPKVRDLAPLAELRRLETLGLSTLPSWDASSKVTEVRSLAPIAKLPSLKHLALFGVVPKGRSLLALRRCNKLVSARFSKYPKAEVKRFYEATQLSDEFPPPPEAG